MGKNFLDEVFVGAAAVLIPVLLANAIQNYRVTKKQKKVESLLANGEKELDKMIARYNNLAKEFMLKEEKEEK